MTEFKAAVNRIRNNIKRRLSGKFNSIPFSILDQYIPGIMKGVYYIVTANTGIGKTQLTKYLFVLNAIKFIEENPGSGIKLKIFYFALEESKEEFIASLISSRLKDKHGLNVPTTELMSLGNSILDGKIVDLVEQEQEYFTKFFEYVEIIDSISHPTGIYNHVRSYLREHGEEVFSKKKIAGQTIQVLEEYIPDDSERYVIVITDHIGLLTPERGEGGNNLRDSISFFSRTYCRKMLTKKYKCAVVNVQQQFAQQEGLDAVKLDKLEPSLNGLAENKTTSRDAQVVLGLFAPVRYKKKSHMGYDITVMKDNYRSLHIIKNRIGKPNVAAGLFFDGASNRFVQLPKADSDSMDRIYNQFHSNLNG